MAASSKPKSAQSAGIAPGLQMPTFEDLTKMMEQFKLPGVDINALVEWQRKDLETLAEANREAYEGYMALFQRRNEILQEALGEWQRSVSAASSSEAFAERSEAAREGVEKAIANFRELSQLEAQARKRAWKVVQDRMQENMVNFQKLLQSKK